MNEHTNVTLVRVQKTIKELLSLMRIGGGFNQEEIVLFLKVDGMCPLVSEW